MSLEMSKLKHFPAKWIPVRRKKMRPLREFRACSDPTCAEHALVARFVEERSVKVDLNLKGRSALVTGGSKGIGLAIARSLAAEGCDVHLVARTAAELDTVAADIRASYGVKVFTHPADLTESAQVKRVPPPAATSTSWSTARAASRAEPCSRSTRRNGGAPGTSRCSAASTSRASCTARCAGAARA